MCYNVKMSFYSSNAGMQSCKHVHHWSMPSPITLCFTPAHTSIRRCLKSFILCAFVW